MLPGLLVLAQIPARRTPFEETLVERVNRSAEAASAAAKPALLQLLSATTFRTGLAECCPQVANESSERLLSRLQAELRAAELTHNFNTNSSGAWEGDVNISVASKLAYLPNLWTLRYLNYSTMEQGVEDVAEVSLMGFRPFSGNQTVGALPRTFAEAAERPLYTTANMLRLPTGDPTFGDVSVILTPSYAQPLALLEPVDTGNWQESCNVSDRPTGCDRFPKRLDCSAWPAPHAQGTYAHHMHTLLAHANLWRPCDGDLLLQAFRRLYGPGSTPDASDDFIEPDLAGTVRYPEGVKLLVGEFSALFGTPLGEAVRAFGRKWGWALAWGLSAPMRRAANVSLATHQRSLDPDVLDGTSIRNLSLPATSRAAFDLVWRDVSARRAAGAPLTPADWSHFWSQLPSSLDLSSGLRPGQCADLDACVGVRRGAREDECVCYGS